MSRFFPGQLGSVVHLRVSFARRPKFTTKDVLIRFYHPTKAPKPLSLPSGHTSLLPLIVKANNLVVPEIKDTRDLEVSSRMTDVANGGANAVIVPFYVAPENSPIFPPVGLLSPPIVSAIRNDYKKCVTDTGKSPWRFQTRNGDVSKLASISFAPWVNEDGRSARTMHIDRIVRTLRDDGRFKDFLKGWSNESFPVYHHPSKRLPSSCDPVAFTIERAALPLFGFANFGCLLIAYFHCSESGRMMVWVPRRSISKKTWPGRLDVTVGGGIGAGDTASTTIIRECAEEALLDPKYVEDYARSVGVLPFPNRSPEGLILPGLYYLFDLPLPSDGSVRPRTNVADGEVESFELMDAQTILKNLLARMFKPSSALALIDFLIRHGYITEYSDPRFVDVCRELKGRFIHPTPWAAGGQYLDWSTSS